MNDVRYRFTPNAITVARLVLVLPTAFCMVEAMYLASFVLFTLSGLSDGLDGFLARRFGWETTFGKLIDPLADKLMMITAVLTLGLLGHFPLMLMILIIVKDLAILGGVFAYTTLAGFPKIQPTWLGKVTTASQIVLLMAVLLNLGYPDVLPGVFFVIWLWLVVAMTAFDGMSYLWIWTTRLVKDPRWKETA